MLLNLNLILILSHLLILINASFASDLPKQCLDFCSLQFITDEDDFDLVCNKTCKLHECEIGCQKWFTYSNLLSCKQICEFKKSGQPSESIHCNIGCNHALKLYINKTRNQIGTPSAPYLAGDNLKNDSLVLQWKTSVDYNISYLIQFKYSQLNSEWIYYKPSLPVQNGQLSITNLFPYTVYKFRVAWFLLDTIRLANTNFEQIISINFKSNVNKLNSLKEANLNEEVNFLDTNMNPIFSEESVEIRTLPYGTPSLPPKLENCVSILPNKLLINYFSPEFTNGEIISYTLTANLTNQDLALQTNLPDYTNQFLIRDLKADNNENHKKKFNYILGNLLPNSTYLISLNVVNRFGSGPFSTIQCKTLPANGKSNYKQLLFSTSKKNRVEKTIDLEPKLIFATKKLILIKKSTNYVDPIEILFRLEDFHYGENFTSLAVHVQKGELFTADTASNIRRIDLNGKFRKILSFNSLFGNLFTSNSLNITRLAAAGILEVKIGCLTVDWLNDKLYFVRRTILHKNHFHNHQDKRFNSYTDYSELIEVLRSNLDGTDLQVVMRFDFGEMPIQLKVDPYNGYLFWSTINNYHHYPYFNKLMNEISDSDNIEFHTEEELIQNDENLFDSNENKNNKIPKLITSIYRIDLALLNTNHTLSSALARSLVQLNDDNHLLQFTIVPHEFKIYYLKQLKGKISTIVSINLDGSEPLDIRTTKVESSQFRSSLRNLASFNHTFFWTIYNETYQEIFHQNENKYYHNVIYLDFKLNDLIQLELLHPIIQQVPVPLNTINNLQALFLNTDVKIKWMPPEVLPETGLGAYKRWTYELCIMEMYGNYSSNKLYLNNRIENSPIKSQQIIGEQLNSEFKFNEENVYLKKRICFDIKETFCNLGQLKLNTTYLIKVRPISSSGFGPWSSVFTGRTLVNNNGGLRSSNFKPIDPVAPFILFATEDGLIKSNFVGDNIETLLQASVINKNIIKDISWFHDEIFVSLSNGSILHQKKNKWQNLAKIGGVSSISVDWLAEKIYFTNDLQQTISRCNLDGSGLETLNLFSTVKELVLDSINSIMYWSTGHSIDVSYLNSLNKMKYFQVGLFSEKHIMGLTIDYISNRLIFYVQTYENSLLYAGDLLTTSTFKSNLNTNVHLLMKLPIKTFLNGPLMYYSDKIFWINKQNQVTLTDDLALNPSTLSGLRNVITLQVVHSSLQPIPMINNQNDLINVIPDSIDKSTIKINGQSNNFTISWQPVTNVNYGDVKYELILENRENILELQLNTVKYNYPDLNTLNSNQIVLPIIKISIRVYTNWAYSKRTVIFLKTNNLNSYYASYNSKILFYEPPKRPTLLKVTKLDANLYEMTWTSSHVNYLNYLNNNDLKIDEQQKLNSENLIVYCIFKKSVSSDKWKLVYNGTEFKAQIRFHQNELKKSHLIKLIAFNKFGESEPVNYNLNPSLDEFINNENHIGFNIVLVMFGIFATLGVGFIIFYYYEKILTQQSNVKKQLQFGGYTQNELATLTNYPINFKNQNTNDNQLYLSTDLGEFNFLKSNVQVTRQQVDLKKFIGSGAFGDVYEGIVSYGNNKTEKIAVKTLKDKSQKKAFLKEAQLMESFKHPNIVELKGICLTNEPIFLLMELMNRGDLSNYLRSNRPVGAVPSPLSLSDLIEMSIQVTRGCVYLEEKNYIHRDLAARNCLVTIEKDIRLVKIADFGLTREVHTSEYYKAGKDAFLPIRWMPPESLKDGLFTKRSDIWSFGVLLWEIFTLGQRPYQDRDNILIVNFVYNGGRLEKPDTCPDELFDLMLKCWNSNPEERPSFAFCLEKLIELKDIIKISLLNKQITSVHNQSYVLNGNHSTSATHTGETMETTVSTITPYLCGKKAGLIEVSSLPLITQDNVEKKIDLCLMNYDCPDPRNFNFKEKYVNNNHLVQQNYMKICSQRDNGYELPVNTMLVI